MKANGVGWNSSNISFLFYFGALFRENLFLKWWKIDLVGKCDRAGKMSGEKEKILTIVPLASSH